MPGRPCTTVFGSGVTQAFSALLEGAIAEAAKRGEVDLSLVSINSTTARAHHDAAEMHLSEDILSAPADPASWDEQG